MTDKGNFEDGDPFADPHWQATGKSKRRRRSARYIGCPVEWLAWVFPLVRSKEQLLLALILYRRCCICDSKTVAVPTSDLEELDIGRHSKRRLLTALEEAGIVTIGQRNGRTTNVTLTHWPDPPSS